VITGMQGWGDASDFQRFERLRAEGSLRLTGYVTETDLPRLYAGASLFVYPSLYEGFGLPPLEAMASGVPVIVSDRSAMPEIVADAGCQVPARDVDTLANRMRELLEDRTRASQLGQKALVRARDFDWQECVRSTFAVYREFAR
jgi:alpha-1,3-rhamnosyl/mannosyltransferase